MNEPSPPRSSTRRWRLWILPIAVLALVAASIVFSQRAVFAAPEQPLRFSHQIHNQAQIACLFCHPNATRTDIAGLPSVQRCIGCHQTIANDRPEIQTVLGYWERQEPIPWAPVNRMADFVFFSHQPHLSASLNCETCHGAVGQMTVVRPVVDMDMGWCLECHLEQPTEKIAWLTDCLLCHE